MFNLLTVADFSQRFVNILNENLGIWYLIILNAFGVVAMIFKVIEYQQKSRKTILVIATICGCCWLLYFALQGDFVSAIVDVVGVSQYLIFMQRGKKKWADSYFWLVGFLTFQIVFGVVTFKVWQDAFALCAGIFGTIAYFVMSRKTYRLLSFICIVSWLLNSITKFYFIALLNDAFATISLAIAILRYDIINKTDKTEVEQEEKGSIQTAND